MTRKLYQGILIASPICAVIAAIFGALSAYRLAVIFLALFCATLPLLIHLQTQRIAHIARVSESRTVKAIGTNLRGEPVKLSKANSDIHDLTGQLQQVLKALKEQSSEGTLMATANEFRRETRMTRLIMSELLARARQSSERKNP